MFQNFRNTNSSGTNANLVEPLTVGLRWLKVMKPAQIPRKKSVLKVKRRLLNVIVVASDVLQEAI